MITDVLANYWAKVDRRSPNECWLWKGARTEKGYGQIFNGRTLRGRAQRSLATHIALAIDGRPRPSAELMAMHSCDNPRCVNPAHLSWGTKSDNSRDMWAKGRSGYQVKVANAMDAAALSLTLRPRNSKLTNDDVRYIRASPDKSSIALSEELGVSDQCILDVRSGKTWASVV